MSFQVGETIGDYEVIGHLGRGGMGSVYKVRNLISERYEALKLLLPDMTLAPDLVERFTREIKILAGLDHPNIAALHTALRYQNQLLMVMELADGSSLEQLLAARAVGLWDGVTCICHVLAALEYAHSQGVIHRDIKPANIMIGASGTVKLLDFGIASSAGRSRLTQSGAVIGSAYYMSPEQVRAQPLDARTDLYSVGVTLYEVATGRRPFEADHGYAIMRMHMEDVPVPAHELNPSVPPLLSAIISRALEKDPAARFQHAGEFRSALGVFSTGVFSATVPTAPAIAAASHPTMPTPLPAVPTNRITAPAEGGADPEELGKLAKELATYIGPMARILVSRAAKTGAPIDQLYVTLAAEIASEKDRQKFLASRRNG